MAHVFLSDEWFEAVRSLHTEFADRLPDPPTDAVANITVSGVPFGAGRIEMSLDAGQGRLAIEHGHRDDAELTLTTDYDTARALLLTTTGDGGGLPAVTRAFFEGRILLQGDITRFMALQQPATEIDPVAAELAQRVRDLTEPPPPS